MSAVLCYGEGLATVNRPADAPPPAAARCWMSVAGAEMNVAIGLARLGHAVRWATALGDDPLGDAVLAAARGEGVQVEAARLAQRTGLIVKVARADDEPEILYYRDGSAFAIAPPQPSLDGVAAVFLSGVTPALSPACRAAAMDLTTRAVAAGIPLWFDLNMRRRLWSEAEAAPVLRWFCQRADTVFAAEDEAALVVAGGTPEGLGRGLLALGARRAVIKAGAAAWAFEAGACSHQPRLPGVIVRDPIGAGDAFDAGFLAAQLDGQEADDALRQAHACAAAVCRTHGDWEGFPRRRELAAARGVALR